MKNAGKSISTVAALLAIAFALSAAIRSQITAAQTQNKLSAAKSSASKSNAASIPAGTYNLDPAHSVIGFSIRHLEINWVEGRFKDFSGAINYNEQDATKSTVEFAAKIESIDTGVAPRDQHLRTADFFDQAKFPQMTFKSKSVENRGADGFVLNGDLTIKNVTKQVSIPFTTSKAIKDPWGNRRFGIEARVKINRRDFNINYGSELAGGGLDIGNEVTINLLLEAVKPEPKTAGE